MLSDEKLSFGQAMGLVVEEVGVLGRSVFLTDKNRNTRIQRSHE